MNNQHNSDRYLGIMMAGIGLSFFLVISLLVAPLVEAQSKPRNTVIRLGDGSSFIVHCVGGALQKPRTTEKSFVLTCKHGDTPPPNDDKPNCKPADPPLESIDNLRVGEEYVKLTGNGPLVMTKAFRFTSAIMNTNTMTISIGPHFAGTPAQSYMTTVALSRCPGDFSVERECFRSGSISNMRISKGGSARGVCKVEVGKQYYVNVAPMNPNTKRSKCSGQCGIVMNVKHE